MRTKHFKTHNKAAVAFMEAISKFATTLFVLHFRADAKSAINRIHMAIENSLRR